MTSLAKSLSSPEPLVCGSLLNRELLAHVFAAHHVTHVIHLAALLTPACQADPWEGCRVNVLGSVALLEQVRASAIRIQGFSYASSVAVFGDEPDHASGTADGVSEPPTFYGAFKKSAELIADQYWRYFQLASVGIRPQVAYGPERDVGLPAGPSLAAHGEEHCSAHRAHRLRLCRGHRPRLRARRARNAIRRGRRRSARCDGGRE